MCIYEGSLPETVHEHVRWLKPITGYKVLKQEDKRLFRSPQMCTWWTLKRMRCKGRLMGIKPGTEWVQNNGIFAFANAEDARTFALHSGYNKSPYVIVELALTGTVAAYGEHVNHWSGDIPPGYRATKARIRGVVTKYRQVVHR